MQKITQYTGQGDVMLIQDEKTLLDPIYQKMGDQGIPICLLSDYIKYMDKNPIPKRDKTITI